jgi:hypothetical protein
VGSVPISWLNATNGNYDFTVDSNQVVWASFAVTTNSTATNIIANYGTSSGRPIEGRGLQLAAGYSGTNASVGGLIFSSTTAFTNCCAAPGTLTNMAGVSIPGNLLTNINSAIKSIWGGNMKLATAATNNFRIQYGGTTILDTGSQNASNSVWRATCTIITTGASAQHCEAHFEWGPAGVPFAFTNSNLELALANGSANTIQLQGSSTAVSVLTNNSFRVFYEAPSK